MVQGIDHSKPGGDQKNQGKDKAELIQAQGNEMKVKQRKHAAGTVIHAAKLYDAKQRQRQQIDGSDTTAKQRSQQAAEDENQGGIESFSDHSNPRPASVVGAMPWPTVR